MSRVPQPLRNPPPALRPLASVILGLAIPFHAIASWMFADYRTPALAWLIDGGQPLPLAVALFRSLVNPSIVGGPSMAMGHSHAVALGAFGAGLLLVMRGGALEGLLGRAWSVAIFLGGCLGGVLLGIAPFVTMTGAFWLGHAGLVVLLGAGVVVFLDSGRVGAAIAAIVILLWLTMTQGVFWLPNDVPAVGREIRNGPIGVPLWNLILAAGGASVGHKLLRRRETNA